MSDPVRLMNRSGLASALLRAGSEERPSSARLRRAVSTLGAGAAVASLTGEAAGTGAGALASGVAGSALAKAGAGSVSIVLAAKWVGIGSLGALVTLGAAEIGSRRAPTRDALETPHLAAPTSEPAARAPFGHSPSTMEGTVPPPEIIEVTKPLAKAVEIADPVDGEIAPRTVPNGPAPAPPAPALLPVRPSVALGQGVTPRTALEPPRSDVAAPPHDPSVAWAGQPAEERALGESLAVPEELAADPKAQIPAGQTLLRLSKEVALVDRAWGAMKRSEFSRALIELANYEEQYPELGLHPEVLFVRMEAEDRLGRVAAAKREAARLLASYSQSAQAGRARALLQRP